MAWQESQPFDGAPRLIYGYTSDFKSITRDPRGHVKWEGSDGSISACREANTLYLFSGKHVHQLRIPVKPRNCTPKRPPQAARWVHPEYR